MINLMLVTSFLAAPAVCPPDLGIVRWVDATYNFTVSGKKYDVTGSIWDRDRNSAPSAGDIMRIESATAAGNAMTVDAVWIILDKALAKTVATQFGTREKPLATECDAPFEVKEVPTVPTDVALAKLLVANDTSVPQISVEQEAEKAMYLWAEERCNNEKYADGRALRAWLVKNGQKTFADLGKAKIKKLSEEVARKAGEKCNHLKGPKISF